MWRTYSIYSIARWETGFSAQGSSSQLGPTVPPRGHLAVSGDKGLPLASNAANLQCIAQPLQQRRTQPKVSVVLLPTNPVLGAWIGDKWVQRKNGFRNRRRGMKRFKALDRESLIKKIPVWGKKIPIYLEVFSSLEYYVLYVNLKNKIKTKKLQNDNPTLWFISL